MGGVQPRTCGKGRDTLRKPCTFRRSHFSVKEVTLQPDRQAAYRPYFPPFSAVLAAGTELRRAVSDCCNLARIHAMLASWGALAYAPPPMYNISAVSLRDAGLQQGRLARERIRGWLGTTEMTELAEYAITGEGQAAFRQLKADNTRFAPLLVGELEGIASGAEVRTSRTLKRDRSSPAPCDPDPSRHHHRRRRRRCLST